MIARALFDAALSAARDWHSSIPEMSAFCDWPSDLNYEERTAVAQPVIPHLQSDPGTASAESRNLRDALVALAPQAEWRLTYSEQEVGRDMLQRYGWFELAGPDGHFRTDQTRMTVGYWGAGLDYGRHWHEAEELYSVVAGSATFMADGEAPRTLGPGQTRLHRSNQPHAMTTADQPVLTFVLWRGSGLADPPRMAPP